MDRPLEVYGHFQSIDETESIYELFRYSVDYSIVSDEIENDYKLDCLKRTSERLEEGEVSPSAVSNSLSMNEITPSFRPFKKSKSFKGLSNDSSSLSIDRRTVMILTNDFRLRLTVTRMLDDIGYNTEKSESVKSFKKYLLNKDIEISAVFIDSRILDKDLSNLNYFRLNIPILLIADDSFYLDLSKLSTNIKIQAVISKPIDKEKVYKIFSNLKIGTNFIDWKDGTKTAVNPISTDNPISRCDKINFNNLNLFDG
jgi:hypothetical protein